MLPTPSLLLGCPLPRGISLSPVTRGDRGGEIITQFGPPPYCSSLSMPNQDASSRAHSDLVGSAKLNLRTWSGCWPEGAWLRAPIRALRSFCAYGTRGQRLLPGQLLDWGTRAECQRNQPRKPTARWQRRPGASSASSPCPSALLPSCPHRGKQVAVSWEVQRVQSQMRPPQEQHSGVRVLQAAWKVPLLGP